MSDMLVKLYELPVIDAGEIGQFSAEGLIFRHALPPEYEVVASWVETHFGKGWASEVKVSFSRQPVSIILAIEQGALVGFACYEATARNYFGPTGVLESCRKRGIGRILLLKSLHALHAMGYAYAIIGGVGPVHFYQRVVNATVIPDSRPGLYRGLLKS